MHFLTENDLANSELHTALTQKLTEAQAEHIKVSENYNSGKATAEELIKAKDNLIQIHEEWRNTIIAFKNE
jgi:hypothetical protein